VQERLPQSLKVRPAIDAIETTFSPSATASAIACIPIPNRLLTTSFMVAPEPLGPDKILSSDHLKIDSRREASLISAPNRSAPLLGGRCTPRYGHVEDANATRSLASKVPRGLRIHCAQVDDQRPRCALATLHLLLCRCSEQLHRSQGTTTRRHNWRKFRNVFRDSAPYRLAPPPSFVPVVAVSLKPDLITSARSAGPCSRRRQIQVAFC